MENDYFYPGWLNPNNWEESEASDILSLPSSNGDIQPYQKMSQENGVAAGFRDAYVNELVIPNDVRMKLYYMQEASRIRTNDQLRILQYENAWKQNFRVVDEEMREKYLKKLEECRQRRELSTFGIFEDSAGRLCYEIVDADGNRIGSKRFVTGNNFKMECYWSNHRGRRKAISVVRWSNPEGQIVLRKETPKELERMLANARITIQGGKERRKILTDLLYAFLYDMREMHEVPYTTGWNQMSSGQWHFEKDIKKTLKGRVIEI